MKRIRRNRITLILITLLVLGLTAVGCQQSTGSTGEPIEAEPGVKTVQNFLATSLEPVGNTLYIWGGGWNEEDTGAADHQQAVRDPGDPDVPGAGGHPVGADRGADDL